LPALAVLAVVPALAWLPSAPADAAESKAVLKVLDPRAELYSEPARPISPRLSTLDGKKIAILNNTKPGANTFRPHLEAVLKAKYPTVEFKEFVVSYNDYPKKAEDLKAVAQWADGVIGMLGD
jgi:hypothetical protein